MRPEQRELDDEIRGHLALEIHDRIARGDSPDAARRAALTEFGYAGATREAMRQVWCSRWLDAAGALGQDMRVALRSLLRAKGLAAAVVATLALGIGANAAIFSVVRGVLLLPLVNRDEDRLVYIRQRAPGLESGNMTFSVPEVNDLRSRVNAISGFGEFSTADFTLVGFGEPRVVRAGVVNGAYFEIMGLRPAVGRLLTAADDGPHASAAVVLTHRFWTTALGSDPAVVGRTIQLGPLSATVVGVLEPSIQYPAHTELIANVVTSPHHLGATMVTDRTHRMTELFGRLAPGVSVGDAEAELTAVHDEMKEEHPEAYAAGADMQVGVTRLRDQVTAPARPVLFVLLGAAAIVFVIACSNVANLILARSVRRERELAVRAALGATRGALRRTLLAETLVLCGAGAVLGIAVAQPLVMVVSRFAARFSVRALDVTVDASLLWVGAGLALATAVVLAYVPRLPSPQAPAERAPASGSARLTASTAHRLRAFAATQVACSFVLLAGAGTLVLTLIALQTADTGYDMRRVLAIDVPHSATGVAGRPVIDFVDEAIRRVGALPGVSAVAAGTFVPWRDAGTFGYGAQFAVDGSPPPDGDARRHARLRIVTPGFFEVLGVPLLAGRDFTLADRSGSDPVVIVNQRFAQRMFPEGDALNRTMWWTDSYFGAPLPRRIIGIVADVDDENVVSAPALTVYHPVQQMGYAGRLFVKAAGDPYALVPEVTRTIREISAIQAVERAATLDDVRAEVLAPERLNAFVFSGFAGVALLIAVVGVAGVLAFGVSARTREFGVRLAVGSSPRHLLLRVLAEGAIIVGVGIVAGAAGGYALARLIEQQFDWLRLPGALPMLIAAAILAFCAIIAALLPAGRASRVDVVRALRSE
jgi:putative ABC transport system permease protein